MTGTSQTVTGFSASGVTYYWWVWGIKGSVWTPCYAGWSFVNGAGGPVPTLVSPGNGTTQTGNSVTFVWNPAAAAKYYLHVQTSPVRDDMATRLWGGYVTGTSQTVTGFPGNGITYHWWVWGIAGLGGAITR